MPSKKTPGDKPDSGKSKTSKSVPLKTQGLNVAGSAQRDEKTFQSDRAMEMISELYPLLLQNCVDEEDEVDTQAVFETLAGLTGLFIAEYQEYYGHEKAVLAFQDLIDLALNLYEERTEESEE